MKARLATLLALILFTTLLVAITQSPAVAAPFGARLSRTPPIVGESVRIYGSVPPVTRPVLLQGYRSGRWVGLVSARTGAGGSYAFTVRATASALQYRVFAPRKKIKRKKRPARYSNVVRVAGVRPSLSLGILPAPVGASTTGHAEPSALLTPGVATFRPARPGAPVAIQRWVSGTVVRVATGRQDAGGNFRFKGVAAGSASDPRTFRAVSAPGAGASAVNSAWVTPSYFTNTYDDNFSDAAVSEQKWITRTSEPGSNHKCAQIIGDMVSFNENGNGVATLKAETRPNTSGNTCPNGFWHNAAIGTANATSPYTATYGFFAARVKFQSARGAHGAFWLQGLGPTSAEVDVAEYFGDGRGLANFVHVEDDTILTSGGVQRSVPSILGTGNTPSNGWHVYSVQWSPSGYIFRVDGVATFSTKKPRVASAPEEFVLSLATSDYELPHMTSNTTSMLVDWVRSWQSP